MQNSFIRPSTIIAGLALLDTWSLELIFQLFNHHLSLFLEHFFSIAQIMKIGH